MADQKQMERLQAGVNSWNTWRQHHPQDSIDLSTADLSIANLIGANLIGADLNGANLNGANLNGANLSHANLSRANLSRADLYGADLNDADLSIADLSIANLRDTHLSRADLNDADLNDADLSGANLSGATFSGANLSGANLSDANLSDADLSGANLNSANLRNAVLSGADLNSANLSGTNLSGANLSDANLNNTNLIIADLSSADLRGTNLSGANLSGAKLSGANLSHARTRETSFGDRDLRSLKGLETIHHDGPSPLSINTIYLSEGNIPEVFVQGTGAPDSFTEYMHALVRTPIQYYTCFISYSSKDQHFAERLYNDLQGNGVRCWYARKDLKPGDFYRDHIDESIRVSDKVLLILSEHSVKSTWVEDEVERAWKREGEPTDPGEPVVLFPIRLDDTVMQTKRKWAATLRYLRHIGDFTGWKNHDTYQTHFQQLLHDLKQERPRTVI